MVSERSGLRSVDSDDVSRVIEPRKKLVVGAEAVLKAKATSTRWMAWRVDPTGVLEQGARRGDSPGTWETLTVSTRKSRERPG